ncbi:MAG: hypothetical protein JRG73_04180 [Deltaproteobacteria bacterium]|nr:hypothetical protein [Deltaproteobacteria bacterium]
MNTMRQAAIFMVFIITALLMYSFPTAYAGSRTGLSSDVSVRLRFQVKIPRKLFFRIGQEEHQRTGVMQTGSTGADEMKIRAAAMVDRGAQVALLVQSAVEDGVFIRRNRNVSNATQQPRAGETQIIWMAWERAVRNWTIQPGIGFDDFPATREHSVYTLASP